MEFSHKIRIKLSLCFDVGPVKNVQNNAPLHIGLDIWLLTFRSFNILLRFICQPFRLCFNPGRISGQDSSFIWTLIHWATSHQSCSSPPSWQVSACPSLLISVKLKYKMQQWTKNHFKITIEKNGITFIIHIYINALFAAKKAFLCIILHWQIRFTLKLQPKNPFQGSY